MRTYLPKSSTILLGLLLTVSCTSEAERQNPEVVGRLEDKTIREASGLAHSQRQKGLFWIINDNGAKEIVHAIDSTGARLGEFDLKKSDNVDWEDLASFTLGDTAYLMVADIGDNDAKRDHRTLYFVAEPVPEKDAKAKRDWEFDFTYPDGPRDAEAAAVDVDEQRVLILSKRDRPPQLYSVPIRPESDEPVVARFLGNVDSLEKPSRKDVEFAPKTKDWHWQPVGMDISANGAAAVILTYRYVYYYRRNTGEDWLQTLNSVPARISLGNFENAESVSFGEDEWTVYVTGEDKHARILRIDFSGVQKQ